MISVVSLMSGTSLKALRLLPVLHCEVWMMKCFDSICSFAQFCSLGDVSVVHWSCFPLGKHCTGSCLSPIVTCL